MKTRFFLAIVFSLVFSMAIILPLSAQAFGFGFDDEAETSFSTGFAPAVTVSGEVSASLLGYVFDFSKGFDHVDLSNIFSGKLNFSAGASFADAFISLKLTQLRLPVTMDTFPITIDEAYVRAYFGGLEVEGGLRKLSWGKADSFGPLDVINPLDYSELTDLSSMLNFKIARPLVHLSFRFGSFSKIEGVFVPTFEPLRYDTQGRWKPSQYATMAKKAEEGILARAMEKYPEYASVIGNMAPQISGGFSGFSPEFPNTSNINYFQAGLRFTTTIGPVDIGIQYFYGNLFQPDFTIAGADGFLEDLMWENRLFFGGYTDVPYNGNIGLLSPQIKYNRYHQIGLDYAQVFFGFNLRAEFAFHLTEDLKGDNGSVRNPFIAWSLGFDRDLFWGININIQCNETIRMFHDKIGNNPILDCEAGTDITSTQIIAALSKTFLNDQLELRAAVFWEIEAKDFMIIPSLIWTKDGVSLGLSGGIFCGDDAGQFGQYWENSFVKVVLKYSF
jgi:hypothetical protein